MTGFDSLSTLTDSAAVASRALGGVPVHVLTLDAVEHGAALHLLRLSSHGGSGARIVVDARGAAEVGVGRLAALVRLRRRVRGGDGELVLVADDPLRQLLRRTGLFWSLHCVASPADAFAALIDAAPPHPAR